MNNTADYFDNMVGQDNVKRQLVTMIDGHHGGKPISHTLLVAPKGCGKTEFAKCIARALRKKALLFNSAGIKNAEAFFLDIVTDKLQDKDVTVVFDECHELPKSVQTLMLSMLNPNRQKLNLVLYKDYQAEIDFRRQSFVLATTDPQKVLPALKDRCEIVELEEYKQDEIAQIVGDLVPQVDGQDLLLDVASVCRGNARGACKLAEKIEGHIAANGLDRFGREDWDKVVSNYSILPMGVSRKEWQVLKLVAAAPESGISLSDLAFRIGDTPNVVRLETEAYLRKLDLITVAEGSKRVLTAKGKVLVGAAK